MVFLLSRNGLECGYFPSDAASLASFAGAARGIGAEPSPTMTIIPVVVFVVAPLAADIAPASMRLARAAMSVFFTVQNPFRESR